MGHESNRMLYINWIKISTIKLTLRPKCCKLSRPKNTNKNMRKFYIQHFSLKRWIIAEICFQDNDFGINRSDLPVCWVLRRLSRRTRWWRCRRRRGTPPEGHSRLTRCRSCTCLWGNFISFYIIYIVVLYMYLFIIHIVFIYLFILW
jgi:hypothetical protein